MTATSLQQADHRFSDQLRFCSTDFDSFCQSELPTNCDDCNVFYGNDRLIKKSMKIPIERSILHALPMKNSARFVFDLCSTTLRLVPRYLSSDLLVVSHRFSQVFLFTNSLLLLLYIQFILKYFFLYSYSFTITSYIHALLLLRFAHRH